MTRTMSEFVPIREQRCALHALTGRPGLLQRLSSQFLPPTCLVCSHRVWSPNLPLCHLCDRERLRAPWLTAPIDLPLLGGDKRGHMHRPERLCGAESNRQEQLLHQATMELYVQWHYTPFIRRLLHQAKFAPARRMFSFLGVQIDSTFRILHPHLFEGDRATTVLVPIPPSERHLRERLFNQALLISRELSFGTVADILIRNPRSEPQSTLSLNERKKNMLLALSVKPSAQSAIEGRHVIIIDDIVGSGASMSAARNLFISHGAASVRGIALAISPLFTR